MTFPTQTLTVQDPGPGTTAPPVTVVHVLSGVCTGGSIAVNTPTSIGDITKVRTLLGYGPLAEDVAYALQEFGGPVIAVVHNVTGTNLSAQAMTKHGTGTPVCTLTGIPNDEYAITVTIVLGGAVGTATFYYSLDGFVTTIPATQSQTRVTAATFVIPGTGLTLAFPAGTYVAGDYYTYSTVPTVVASTDLNSAITSVVNAPSIVPDLWHVSGTQASASAAATLATAFAGYMATLTNTQRYVRGMIDIGSGDTENNVLTQALSWASSRVQPAYGYTVMSSCLPFEGFGNRRISCNAAIGIRAMRELMSSDLSRTAAGNCNNVLNISFDANYDTTVDAAQISSMRTWSGKPGFYVAGGKLKCNFGSNFTDLQYGRIMDATCLATYNAQFPFQSATFRTTATGTVDPRDANTLQQTVTSALAAVLTQPLNAEGQPGHVSSFTYTVDLTANILSSQQLITRVALVALGYAKTITTSLAFTVNPQH